MRVDFDAKGAPIGVEITAPSVLTVADLNAVRGSLGVAQLAPEEWAPLAD